MSPMQTYFWMGNQKDKETVAHIFKLVKLGSCGQLQARVKMSHILLQYNLAMFLVMIYNLSLNPSIWECPCDMLWSLE
jgi:hypothetical protein